MWVKIDDQFDDSEDIDILSPDAVALFVCALSWSARHLTDGRVPKRRVARLKGGTNKAALELLGVGWWTEDEDNYYAKSYLKFNPSAEKVTTEETARTEKAKANATKRWNATGDATSIDPSINTTDATDDATTYASSITSSIAPSIKAQMLGECSVPVPVPVPVSVSVPVSVPGPEIQDQEKHTDSVSGPTEARAPTQLTTPLVPELAKAPLQKLAGTKPKPSWRPTDFDRFYAAYPRHDDPMDAARAWDNLKPGDEMLEEIAAALSPLTGPASVTPAERCRVKAPGAWLRARRWESDDPFPGLTIARSMCGSASKGRSLGGLKEQAARMQPMIAKILGEVSA